MSLASDLITDALYTANVVGLEETPGAAETSFALRRLNRLLDAWSNESLLIYDVYIDSIVLVPGTQQYSTALLTNGRPITYDDCYLTLSGVSYPIDLITNQDWNAIPFKGTSGLPDRCWVDISYPANFMNFFPVPSAAYTANFSLRRVLSAPLTLASVVALPPGYEELIVTHLAMHLRAMTNKPADAVLTEQAQKALMRIKSSNLDPLQMDSNLPVKRRLFNIQRGY